MRVSGSAALMALFLSGCFVPELDLSGRPCPCVTGFVCVNDECVAEGSALDAGVDADLGDAAIDVDSIAESSVRDAGGEADVAEPDTSGDGGSNGCPGLYCQDFESDAWMLDSSASSRASLSAESDGPHRGAGAARFSVQQHPSDRSALFSRVLADTANDEVHLRAWIYVDGLSEARLLQLSIGDTDISASYQDGRARLLVEGGAGTADSDWTMGMPLPMNEWFCLRLSVETDSDGSMIQGQANDLGMLRHDNLTVLVDDQPIIAKAGVIQTPRMTSGSVLVDDLVVSERMLPCEAAF